MRLHADCPESERATSIQLVKGQPPSSDYSFDCAYRHPLSATFRPGQPAVLRVYTCGHLFRLPDRKSTRLYSTTSDKSNFGLARWLRASMSNDVSGLPARASVRKSR